MSKTKFVKALVSNFDEEYLRSPNNNDIFGLLALGESYGVLIACTGNGRIVSLHGKVTLLVMFMNQQLFWKLWHQMIYGYGMHSLGYQDLITTSTC